MTRDDGTIPGRGHVERLEAVVVGRVQGVGYRYFVMDAARSLGLTGWVQNEDDGTVRCLVEGPRSDLDRLVAALREGPPMAQVDHVAEMRFPATDGFDRFEIRTRGHRGD